MKSILILFVCLSALILFSGCVNREMAQRDYKYLIDGKPCMDYWKEKLSVDKNVCESLGHTYDGRITYCYWYGGDFSDFSDRCVDVENGIITMEYSFDSVNGNILLNPKDINRS